MKRFIALIAALIASFGSFNATARQQVKKTDDHSLLWRISGKGLAKPSYLFGTIHIICKDDYLWTGKMKESLTKSDKVCFEMDITDPTVMMQVAAGMIDKNGKQLKDYFTPAQYKLLEQYMKDSIGMSLSLLVSMNPVFLQTVMEIKKMVTCTDPTSYEETISGIAVKDHKKVAGLETPQEQIAALETIPTDSVIKAITDQLQGTGEDGIAVYEQMLAAYKRQDLPALYNLITTSPGAGEDMGPLLDERNKKWIARMQETMIGSSVFFAVGAGHLYGPKGVITLLRKEGYNVDALR